MSSSKISQGSWVLCFMILPLVAKSFDVYRKKKHLKRGNCKSIGIYWNFGYIKKNFHISEMTKCKVKEIISKCQVLFMDLRWCALWYYY